MARIERKIRTVKERVRAHIAHQLPYTLPTLGISMLVLFCISRINYQIPGMGNRTESPRVAFSGRQAKESLDFRAGFGEYAQCTFANFDSGKGARTEDCIVMLPTSNRTGSVKLTSLSTGRLVTRDQFKVLLMQSTVIARLNSMAASEGRRIGTRTTMVYESESGLEKPGEVT